MEGGLDAAKAAIWNVFFHLYVTEYDLSVLRSHLNKLIDASASYETWMRSSYGQFIKYVDKGTLAHLRTYWSYYAETGKEQVSVRNKKARDTIAKRSKDVGKTSVLNGIRAAGPLWPHAFVTAPDLYRLFWKTGVAAGNAADVEKLGDDGKGEVNPLFAVSSAAAQDFAVHYATEPLVNFHVADAYCKVPAAKGSQNYVDHVVAAAKAQFEAWCEVFSNSVNNGHVIVRCFYGDALAFGHEMQLHFLEDYSQSDTQGFYRKTWSSDLIVLDGECPRTKFNVIDTSNLGDHVGVINVLSATAPLLNQDSSSAIYTESLLIATEDTSAALSTLLGSDVMSFALLIGLSPSGLQTNVTMDAVGNEAALYAMTPGDGSLRQYRMRMTWKHLESGDLQLYKEPNIPQVAFEPESLAAYLFSLYRKFFALEDQTQLSARMATKKLGSFSIDQARYTRAGMVALIKIAKSRVMVDWEETLELFMQHVKSDRSLIVGSNSLQELYMHLHLSGVWTNDVLGKDPRQLDAARHLGFRSRSDDQGLLATRDIPPVVYLVLVVPRKKLEVFTKKNIDKVGTPALHIAVSQNNGEWENCFFSYQCFFGNVSCDPTTHELISIEEDEMNWAGTQDLITLTPVPAFGLLTGPKDGIRVALRINASPEYIMAYSAALGLLLTIYETGFTREGCFVCKGIAGHAVSQNRAAQKKWIEATTKRHRKPTQSLVLMDANYNATHLQRRIDFPPRSTAGKALSDGASVAIEQISPSVLIVHIGKSIKNEIIYVVPIQGSKAKTRVARKSSWIELSVPIMTAQTPDPFDSFTQLIVKADRHAMLRDLPHIDLSNQPQITISKTTDNSWIRTFMGATLSDSENAINNTVKNSPTSGNAMIDLKQSLNTLFATFAGLHPSAQHNSRNPQVYQLTINKSCHTILFATTLYHDLDLGSICLEAYVFPLTILKVQRLSSALANLQQAAPPCGIHVTPAETTLWKRLLPALAERCRTGPHKPSCEYLCSGATIPLSTAEAENPICSCGEGELSGPEFVKKGGRAREWEPFARYVTRIAISPIFPVPFVESSLSAFRGMRREVWDRAAGAGAGSKSGVASQGGAGRGGCDRCGKRSESGLKTCAGCGEARYCGVECQKASWKEHKPSCKKG